MTINNTPEIKYSCRSDFNDNLLEIIACFTKEKMEIFNVFSLDEKYNHTNHETCTIKVNDNLWDYFFHGKEEICFRRKTRHRITIDIIDKNEWRAFDACTLKQYIGTKKKKSAEEHEIARLDKTNLLQHLLILCEQSDSGVRRYDRNINEFIYLADI